MNCVPIDMLPTPWAGEIRWSLLHFGTFIHCFFAAQRLHAQTSVTSYTSVNIYNFNSRLAHFNALWMEYIRSLRTGIMAEYPVMSTSQGSYVRIEQTSEAIRVTYEICRAGGREDWNWEPLPYTQRHCHVRIEKAPVQTVAIKLKAHNSLEYHYMLEH